MAIEYMNVVTGLIGGVAFSLSGWVKNARKNNDSFDWNKLGVASGVGLIYGLVSAFTMQDISIVANGTIGVAVTGLVQNIWKAIFR